MAGFDLHSGMSAEEDLGSPRLPEGTMQRTRTTLLFAAPTPHRTHERLEAPINLRDSDGLGRKLPCTVLLDPHPGVLCSTYCSQYAVAIHGMQKSLIVLADQRAPPLQVPSTKYQVPSAKNVRMHHRADKHTH